MSDIDRRVQEIRNRRSTPPDSHVRRYLAARGMEAEASADIANLEIAVASLVAAFYGELDARNSQWLPYLEDKAETAARAAGKLAHLAELARGLPSPSDPTDEEGRR
jgi:hypothetical protein